MAIDLKRWVQTLTDHLVFSFQVRHFVTGNKQGVVRALRFREDWVKEAATFLSWAVSCSQGWVVICLPLEHKGPDASSCPQVAIFSSAPGGQLFSQEPGWALSVVSETKALTYTLLARLITFYLKLKFSNSWVPYQSQGLKGGRGSTVPKEEAHQTTLVNSLPLVTVL